jgi:hypothetical protein
MSEGDDLGDSRSRLENSMAREMARRRQSAEPEYAYAPRYIPIGNWHATAFDTAMAIIGVVILVIVAVVNFLF